MLSVFNTPNGYVIVQLTGKRKEGLATAKDASARVLPILREQKKAAIIKEQNAGKSLDELAKDNNVNVSSATGLTMKTPTISGAGREPKVVGVAMDCLKMKIQGLLKEKTECLWYRLPVNK